MLENKTMLGKSICLLEDNDDIREILEYLLNDENYEVFSYATVRDFELNVKNIKPDLFLLDVMLPDGNGLDVCQKLKTSQITHAIPVFMMSAHAQLGEMKQRCAAEGFVTKPFDVFDLISKIDRQMTA